MPDQQRSIYRRAVRSSSQEEVTRTNPEAQPQRLSFRQLVLMWSLYALALLACLEAIAKLLDRSASWPFVPVFVATVAVGVAVGLLFPLVCRPSTTVSNAAARGVTQR